MIIEIVSAVVVVLVVALIIAFSVLFGNRNHQEGTPLTLANIKQDFSEQVKQWRINSDLDQTIKDRWGAILQLFLQLHHLMTRTNVRIRAAEIRPHIKLEITTYVGKVQALPAGSEDPQTIAKALVTQFEQAWQPYTHAKAHVNQWKKILPWQLRRANIDTADGKQSFEAVFFKDSINENAQHDNIRTTTSGYDISTF